MKYESKKMLGSGNTGFNCLFGAQELEMLAGMAYNALKYTPKTTENQIYRARLKTLAEQLGDIYKKEVQGKDEQNHNHWD